MRWIDEKGEEGSEADGMGCKEVVMFSSKEVESCRVCP